MHMASVTMECFTRLLLTRDFHCSARSNSHVAIFMLFTGFYKFIDRFYCSDLILAPVSSTIHENGTGSVLK